MSRLVTANKSERSEHVVTNFHADVSSSEYSNKLNGNFFLKVGEEFEPHYVVLQGNEIYIYTNKDQTNHKFMHSLTSCFIKTDSEEPMMFNPKTL